MQQSRYISLFGIIVCTLSLTCAPACHAILLFDVSLDTSPLIGEGPFFADFQLNDGSGSGDTNNTASLRNIDLGGGSLGSIAISNGGATGSLTSTMMLTDSAFLNEFTQQFNAGFTLTFNVSLTTNVDRGPTPDAFSFAILDNMLAPLPTSGLGDALLLININSSNPSIETFGTTPEGPFALSAPRVRNAATSIPDTGSSIGLLSLGLLGLGALRRKLRVSA